MLDLVNESKFLGVTMLLMSLLEQFWKNLNGVRRL